MSQVVVNYPGQNKTAEQAWDYLQRTVSMNGRDTLSLIQTRDVYYMYSMYCHENHSVSVGGSSSGMSKCLLGCQFSLSELP